MYQPRPEPDLTPYEGITSREYGAFAEVLSWAVSLGFAYARTNRGYTVITRGEAILHIPRQSYLDNPLQAARSLVQAVKEELG